MFEFQKLCGEYEKMSALERGAVLATRSARVLTALSALEIPGVSPVETLAGFIIGAVVSDGKLSEQEYLLIYPSLLRIFGDDFDFERVKESVKKDADGRRAIQRYTRELCALLALMDDSLRDDVVMISLCALSVDGRISLRERNYVKKLCRAA